MTVIIVYNISQPVRGLLRRWFIEPKPNVFVGSVNTKTREKTIDYLRRNAPGLSMLLIFDDKSTQGFTILSYGNEGHRLVRRSGLELILENSDMEMERKATSSQAEKLSSLKVGVQIDGQKNGVFEW